MRRWPAVLLAVGLGAGSVVAGCAAQSHGVVLDGRPRVPDAQGVVASVDAHRIVLDGGRAFTVSPRLQSFSSETLAPASLLQRQGQYVQIGLDGRQVDWIAAIGAVVPTDPPVVFYLGWVVRGATIAGRRRLVFRDGTVLDDASGTVGAGLRRLPRYARAEIDPGAHVVRRVVLLPAPSGP